jgi:hypothetical protein
VNDFNAEIQSFMAVRNMNTFIAFLTSSDIYVCITLFALQAVVQRIPDAADIPVPTWQPPPPRVGRSRNGPHGHRQGHLWLRLAKILLKPSQI